MFILCIQHFKGADSIQHGRNIWIDDGQIQSGFQRHQQKAVVEQFAVGQTEGDVGNAQQGAATQLLFDHAHCLQCFYDLFLLHRGSQGQAVHIDVLARDAVLLGVCNDSLCDGKPFLCQQRDSLVVQGQRNDCRTIFFDQRQDGVHRAFLPVDRVDDGFSVVETQRLLDGFDIGGVDLQRSIQHALQLLNNQRQHPALIDLGHSHVDIQDLCACLQLRESLAEDVVKILLQDCLL